MKPTRTRRPYFLVTPGAFILSVVIAFTLTGISRFQNAALAEDAWPQFRGPSGQGDSDARGLPLKWGEGQNVAWKTAIHGKAWSSPVVLGKQIWLTTATEDGRQLFAICVDRDSGKIVHDVKLFDVATPQYAHPFNSYASPTPAIEPGRLYVSFGSPGIGCVDTETGKLLWERRDFVCNHYRGAGTSPMLWRNLMFLNFDGSDFQYVVALDKNTGKTVWRTNRGIDYQDLGPDGKPQSSGDWRKAFSTPRPVVFEGELGGRQATDKDEEPILLSLGSKALYGYEAKTGKELWRTEDRSAHSGSATPVVGRGLIFTCTGLGKPELWAIRPGGHGVVTDSHVAWKAKGRAPAKPSVLLVGDLIYLVDDGGTARCLEADTGKEVWQQRMGGNYSASPLYADGRVYFFSEEGKTTVIAAGDEGRTYKVLAENHLDGGFMASPAVAGESLILRTKTHLYRIDASAK